MLTFVPVLKVKDSGTYNRKWCVLPGNGVMYFLRTYVNSTWLTFDLVDGMYVVDINKIESLPTEITEVEAYLDEHNKTKNTT